MRQPIPAPLTREDSAVMEGIRQRWRYPLNHWYQYYDRADALVMLGLLRLPELGINLGAHAAAWVGIYFYIGAEQRSMDLTK